MVVTMRIISTGPMTMPQGPNIAIPPNTDSNMSAWFSRASRGTRIGRKKLSIFEDHDEMPQDYEHPTGDVAVEDHSDAKRNRHDAAAQRNDRQRGQQNRENEEAVVKSADVYGRGAGDTLA